MAPNHGGTSLMGFLLPQKVAKSLSLKYGVLSNEFANKKHLFSAHTGDALIKRCEEISKSKLIPAERYCVVGSAVTHLWKTQLNFSEWVRSIKARL